MTGAERAAVGSVPDRTPFKDQTGEGSTFPVSQQEVARTFP